MEALVNRYGMAAEAPVAASHREPFAAEISGLMLSLGGQALFDRLNFKLHVGEVVLLRGENGSGKTTLLNVLSGFIRPDAGQVLLCLGGHTVNTATVSPERLTRMGLGRLWQDVHLFPSMSVLDNVLSASPELLARDSVAALARWPSLRKWERRAQERAMHHLAQVGLADRAFSTSERLSLGQMKRVALARLLQADADLWLLDEPLAGLDKPSADGLLGLLESLNASHRKSVIVVEHQHEQMAPICDRTWFLVDGQLRAEARS